MLAELKLGPIAFEHPGALLATVLGFLLLLLLMHRMAGPGIRTHFATRTAHIVEVHEQAERQLADAQQIRDDYARRIASIEVEHRQRLDAAVRDSDAARADIIADAQAAAKALLRRTAEELGRERTKQRILLRQQIVQITLDAAEQSIHELNSEASQHLLIADFVTRVGVHATNGNGAVARDTRVVTADTASGAVADAGITTPTGTQPSAERGA